MDSLDTVLEHIKAALEIRGLNQRKLAKLIKVDEGAMSRILHKQQSLSVETLLKIAKVLNVDSCSLLPQDTRNQKVDFEEYIKTLVRTLIKEELENVLKK